MTTISCRDTASSGFICWMVRALDTLTRWSRQLFCQHSWEPVWFNGEQAAAGEELYRFCILCHKRVTRGVRL